MRATPEISGAPGSIRTRDRVPVRHEVEDDPDGRAPPGSEMREEWGARGLGRDRKRAGGLGYGGRKGKRRVGGFWAVGEKRKGGKEREEMGRLG